MTFVRVKHAGMDSQSAKNTHAADAEHDFLSNPVFFVSSVKACGKFAIAVLVFVDIRVHQIERNRPEVHAPDNDKDVQAPDVQFDEKPFIVFRTCGFDWRFAPFEQFVNVFLPAVRLNPLVEISLRVDEPHTQ